MKLSEINKIISRYTDFYNKTASKVQAASSLIALIEGQDRLMKSLESFINKSKERISSELDEHEMPEVKEKIIDAYEKTEKGLDVDSKSLNDEYSRITGGANAVNIIFERKEQLIAISWHKGMLESLLTEIISCNYPKKIETKDVRAHNYAGGLSDECIEDMRKLREEHPDMSSKEFVQTAHSRFPSCRKTEDGKSIKWRTLENRIKEIRPDIYERHGEEYKPF